MDGLRLTRALKASPAAHFEGDPRAGCRGDGGKEVELVERRVRQLRGHLEVTAIDNAIACLFRILHGL